MRATPTTVFALAAASALAITAATAQEAVRNEQTGDELRGNWVIGTTVRSTEDEVIGTVTDILIDTDDGTVTGAVIDVGGFLGFGAKPIVVEWEALDILYDASNARLDLSREEAEAAPEFAFREQATPPPPEPPAGTGTGMGTGTDSGTDTGTGTSG